MKLNSLHLMNNSWLA